LLTQMSFDPKSHARAVVLATTMNSVVPAPSLFELQIRVPAIYAIAPKYAPPFDPLGIAKPTATRLSSRRCCESRSSRSWFAGGAARRRR